MISGVWRAISRPHYWQEPCSTLNGEARMLYRLVAVAGVLLIAAFALCLLDASHAADGDLCSASVVPSVGLAVPFLAILTGRVLPEADATYLLCPSDRLVPPPRS